MLIELRVSSHVLGMPDVSVVGRVSRINTCMYEEDFYQLDRVPSCDDIRTITVLGGGFLGTEVASLLATACNGKKEIQHVSSTL